MCGHSVWLTAFWNQHDIFGLHLCIKPNSSIYWANKEHKYLTVGFLLVIKNLIFIWYVIKFSRLCHIVPFYQPMNHFPVISEVE